MDKSVYLHSIYSLSDYYNSRKTLKVLKNILEADALLSARLQQKKYHLVLFNGWDYISLCDYEKKELSPRPFYNSYEGYIRYSLSLVFPKNKLNVIVPEIVDTVSDYETMRKYGLSTKKRYSDLPDEVQVKDKIPLNLMSGITIPVSKMRKIFVSEKKTADIVLKELEKINILLSEYNYNVPIYDIDTLESLDKEENVKQLVKHYYRNRD